MTLLPSAMFSCENPGSSYTSRGRRYMCILYARRDSCEHWERLCGSARDGLRPLREILYEALQHSAPR